MRRAVVLALLAAFAGCGGGEEPERELEPGGRVVIGVVAGERLVAEGARVEANRINNAGGIGGALTLELAHGSVEELLARGIRLLVVPCRRAVVPAVHAADAARAVAVAPCDDGILAFHRHRRLFAANLSPGAQAETLAEHVDGRARVLPPTTRRGARVERLLELERDDSSVVSPDAPERVEPPDAPDGTIFATFGFPDPGNRTDEFYERFLAVYARRPESIVAALASNALTVLAIAIEEAASVQPALVAQAFRDGFDARGVFGEIEFVGRTNRPEVAAAIVQLRDGRLRTVD